MSLPCKTCITLAICKSFYTIDREGSDVFGTLTRQRMENKCSIIKKWLHYSFDAGIIPENVRSFHRFFRRIDE